MIVHIAGVEVEVVFRCPVCLLELSDINDLQAIREHVDANEGHRFGVVYR